MEASLYSARKQFSVLAARFSFASASARLTVGEAWRMKRLQFGADVCDDYAQIYPIKMA